MRLTYKNEKISGKHSVGVEQKIKSICDTDKGCYGFAIIQFLIHDFVKNCEGCIDKCLQRAMV
jgi:hypothetical protein